MIKPHDFWADLDNEFYKKVTSLKRYGIKVTIAIGGWNDSLGGKFSRLVNDPVARAKFVKHVVEFVESHGFDGLGNYKFCVFYVVIFFWSDHRPVATMLKFPECCSFSTIILFPISFNVEEKPTSPSKIT